MDLVYIVGLDDKHNHLELRYSLRSMEMHLDKISNLILVGECPSFLKDFFHIPAWDPYKYNPARNIYEKILAACRDERVSKNFLLCSDDYFILKDFITDSFPFFYASDLETESSLLSPTGTYKSHIDNTLALLKGKGLPTKYFNVHAPMIVDKELFSMIMPEFHWSIKKGYISKSLYCNAAGITGTPGTDIKIYTPKTKTAIQRKLKEAPYFSTNEFSINDPMKELLEELYPDPSKWEI